MGIKTNTARGFFQTNLELSAEAVAELCRHLNDVGHTTASEILTRFDEENACRRIQGLPPLKRISPRHVKETVEYGR